MVHSVIAVTVTPGISKILKVDAEFPSREAIVEAAKVLANGGLVAFPTETVYGLGAMAFNSDHVAKIFAAKGRPAFNPVIVHVAEMEQAREAAGCWSDMATLLAKHLWPGPLTLVLPRSSKIPDIVTAGGDSVGIRMPAHPVALELIRASGGPVAAPSANRSNGVSPTEAAHVVKSLNGRVDLVLDGGPCSRGIESTVLSLVSENAPCILRPGAITRKQIEDILGREVAFSFSTDSPPDASTPQVSPGMLQKHYSPSATVILVDGPGYRELMELKQLGRKSGWITFDASGVDRESGVVCQIMLRDSEAYAAKLYSALHELDEAAVDTIVVQRPPNAPEWEAVHDRLRRAAAEG